MTGYAELHVLTNFSFLEGASHPEEMVLQAAAQGLKAVVVTDRNTLAGVVRGYSAAKTADIQYIVGAQLDFQDAPSLVCLPTDLAAYSRLSQLISLGRRRAGKGACEIYWADLVERLEGQQIILLAPRKPNPAFIEKMTALRDMIGDNLSLGVSNLMRGRDRQRIAVWAGVAREAGVALVAINSVLYHHPTRSRLQDVLVATRHKCTVEELGVRAEPNGERYIKTSDQMVRLFRDYPEAVARTVEIASRCKFSLSEIRYVYPEESKGQSDTPMAELERLTWKGARKRYPNGIPNKVRDQILHELKLIAQLDYPSYFLTVQDIVKFARSKGILCQGRGSAANSAVCYALGVTSVNPAEQDVLFERFISAERNEPPDIDIDFGHSRREEVIQYIYTRYGRARAGLAAITISFRTKLAIRTVGRAMGMSLDTIASIARTIHWWSKERYSEASLRDAGINPDSPLVRTVVELANELVGFPRHLSQHPGGFVITNGPLADLVPVENARMADRTIVQWDKDDLDQLGLLKVDILGLGMLTCLDKAFQLVAQHYGRSYELANIPQDDVATYDMICEADTIGVFQIESRAQMATLPVMRPRNYYDLVVEVAIIRPGPITGGMVHPYLRRRQGLEKVTYPSEELKSVLGKTMGVLLFQEQAMKLAVVAAGFTPGEADQLRRAMATFRRVGTIHTLQQRFIDGMVNRGYERLFAENIFKQISGFGEYGFPESHAASFALLAYASSWLKCHFPAAFTAAILNSQPMGFYSTSRLIIDARDHGVEIRDIDVNYSYWDSTLEPAPGKHGQALRLGFREIRGFKQEDADRLVEARDGGYSTIREIWRRGKLGKPALTLLAKADALGSLGLDRRAADWAIRALSDAELPLFDFADTTALNGNISLDDIIEEEVRLPRMPLGENVIADFRYKGHSNRPHPLQLLRHRLHNRGIVTARDLEKIDHGTRVTIGGLVQVRQRPGTASGVIFATLQDESGDSNAIIWPTVFDKFRRETLSSKLMIIEGKVQKRVVVLDGAEQKKVATIHVVADVIENGNDYLSELGEIDIDSDFNILSKADEMKSPPRQPKEVLVAMPDSRDFR